MRYILQRRADQLYFCRPQGPDNAEWTDQPREAHQWADYDTCLAGQKVWRELHGVETEVLQIAMGPHFCQVTAVGSPMFSSVTHG
jgi:hypothetical protein